MLELMPGLYAPKNLREWLLYPLKTKFFTAAIKERPGQHGVNAAGEPYLHDESDFCTFTGISIYKAEHSRPPQDAIERLFDNSRDRVWVDFASNPNAQSPCRVSMLSASICKADDKFSVQHISLRNRHEFLERDRVRPTETFNAIAELERQLGLGWELNPVADTASDPPPLNFRPSA